MRVKNVTRDEIRALKPGELAIFTLPTQKARESARVQVSIVKRVEEGRFDYESVKMDELREILGKEFDTVVPDAALTIAFRCTKNETEKPQ